MNTIILLTINTNQFMQNQTYSHVFLGLRRPILFLSFLPSYLLAEALSTLSDCFHSISPCLSHLICLSRALSLSLRTIALSVSFVFHAVISISNLPPQSYRNTIDILYANNFASSVNHSDDLSMQFAIWQNQFCIRLQNGSPIGHFHFVFDSFITFTSNVKIEIWNTEPGMGSGGV